MKRLTFLTFLTAAFLFSIVTMTSCTKEGAAGTDGIDGAVGPAGPQGIAGEAGIDGTDGTAGCILCHDGGTSQGIFAQARQWENSKHAYGGNHRRSSTSCARCHTSQGHIEYIETGFVAEEIINPNPQNCYTCHFIHNTYTPADLENRGAEPFITAKGDYVDFGKGNVCANCHTDRGDYPLPDLNVATYEITSSRLGPHYGPQTLVFSGTGVVKFNGDANYGTPWHMNLTTDGCVDCHMANPRGYVAGGHTMKVSYIYNESKRFHLTGCLNCHADEDILEDDLEAIQGEVEDLLADLEIRLRAAGVMNSSSTRARTGTFNSIYAGAQWNYATIHYDYSLGIHNPEFVLALLKNSKAAVEGQLTVDGITW